MTVILKSNPVGNDLVEINRKIAEEMAATGFSREEVLAIAYRAQGVFDMANLMSQFDEYIKWKVHWPVGWQSFQQLRERTHDR